MRCVPRTTKFSGICANNSHALVDILPVALVECLLVGHGLSKPDRNSPGHPGYADPQDAAMGAAARPRNRPGDPRQIRGSGPRGTWLFVPGAPSAGAARLDYLRVESFGNESKGQILSPHPSRAETASGRTEQVETAGEDDRTDYEAGVGERMRDDELDEELRDDLEREIEELQRSGMSRAEAENSAHRAFGNLTL